MSAKLFNCSPEQLQCGGNALEGYLRPGRLHLTLHAMVRALDHPPQLCPRLPASAVCIQRVHRMRDERDEDVCGPLCCACGP